MTTRPWPNPTAARAWPVPTEPTTILCVGDVHWGGINVNRAARVTRDMQECRLLPPVAAIVQIGDSTHNGTTAEDESVDAFLAGLGSEPVHTACGNHDIWNNARTPADWATYWGVPSKNYTVELDFATLIFVGPDVLTADNTKIILTQATLDWLDAQLAASTKRCIIVCHAPLFGTVLGDSTSYTSRDASFHVQAPTEGGQSAAIYDVLATHDNAIAWISGHTHSPPTSPRLVTGVTVGSHTLAAINCSALYYVGKSVELSDPLVSMYVTLLTDRIEVRFRDHAAKAWCSPDSKATATVLL